MGKKDKVKQLTFGVSFNHMFKLLDSWGEIADDILYRNKLFSSEFFTNISTHYTTERRLSNPEKNHVLILSSNKLVFTQTIEKDFDSEFNLFKKRVVDYIIPNILTRYTLIVRRLGVVYTCELEDEIIKKFAAQYFNPSVQNIMDFRFSKKEPTVKGTVFSENSDFINKIFTVGRVSDNIKGISYDYQLHFTPLREDIRNEIEKFISNSQKDFGSDIIDSLGDKNE